MDYCARGASDASDSGLTWYFLMRHIDEAESFGAVRLPHLATAPRFALSSR